MRVAQTCPVRSSTSPPQDAKNPVAKEEKLERGPLLDFGLGVTAPSCSARGGRPRIGSLVLPRVVGIGSTCVIRFPLRPRETSPALNEAFGLRYDDEKGKEKEKVARRSSHSSHRCCHLISSCSPLIRPRGFLEAPTEVWMHPPRCAISYRRRPGDGMGPDVDRCTNGTGRGDRTVKILRSYLLRSDGRPWWVSPCSNCSYRHIGDGRRTHESSARRGGWRLGRKGLTVRAAAICR